MNRAPRNRSVCLDPTEQASLATSLVRLSEPTPIDAASDRVVSQDCVEAVGFLPDASVDLLVLDPPYNLNKQFGGRTFKATSTETYAAWMDDWLRPMLRLLKTTASVYVCGDWRSAGAIHEVLARHLHVRNRITWEREKGRGALANWKNCSEDIWFATVSDTYTFNLDAVRLRRRVLAPYRDTDGRPKDWEDGYRDTCPSNLWTDVTVPFWSMPENTEHPAQKPEKLLAKLILASSDAGQMVLDPFLGSGTTAVVAKKLGRRFIGIEIDERYACLALKRLALATGDPSIQGYRDQVFWERNTQALQGTRTKRRPDDDVEDVDEPRMESSA
jgi:site-specific DNA-methyltransferase (adenine-specific)